MKDKSIFDNINDLFFNKPAWETYTESDKKKFSPYMINRWISQSSDFIEIINYLQQYTIGILSNREVYKLLKDFLPKMKFFTKYSKADESNNDKYSEALISLLCETYLWNEKQCFENLKILDISIIETFLRERGYSDGEIKKLIKVKIK